MTTLLIHWMKKTKMNEQEIINYKLSLAAAWLQNGQEDLARSIITSIIERAEGQND